MAATTHRRGRASTTQPSTATADTAGIEREDVKDWRFIIIQT
jgi:hypothetical protein